MFNLQEGEYCPFLSLILKYSSLKCEYTWLRCRNFITDHFSFSGMTTTFAQLNGQEVGDCVLSATNFCSDARITVDN